MTLHREGTRYIILATIVLIVVGFLTKIYLFQLPLVFYFINLVVFLLWFWVIWFFRLPSRSHMEGHQLIVSPADGKVVVIEETYEAEYFKDQRLQISIFMSPLNVHVNRSPMAGTVKLMKYHPGKYLVAWHPKSSTENERTTLVIENSVLPILVRQIAGAVARRIKFYVKEGQELQQNEEFGFIRFGSRVDIYLPVGTKVNVNIGEKVQGGITVLAEV